MKQIRAEIAGVVIQPRAMRHKMDQRMPRPPLAMPMPITAPITACELETGTSGSVGSPLEDNKFCKPCEANINKTKDWETTTIQAIIGDMDITPLPMVRMILCE